MVFGVPRNTKNRHFVWSLLKKTEFSNVWLLGAVLEGIGAVLGGLGSIFERLGAVFGRLGAALSALKRVPLKTPSFDRFSIEFLSQLRPLKD